MKIKAKHGIKENSHLVEQAEYIQSLLEALTRAQASRPGGGEDVEFKGDAQGRKAWRRQAGEQQRSRKRLLQAVKREKGRRTATLRQRLALPHEEEYRSGVESEKIVARAKKRAPIGTKTITGLVAAHKVRKAEKRRRGEEGFKSAARRVIRRGMEGAKTPLKKKGDVGGQTTRTMHGGDRGSAWVGGPGRGRGGTLATTIDPAHPASVHAAGSEGRRGKPSRHDPAEGKRGHVPPGGWRGSTGRGESTGRRGNPRGEGRGEVSKRAGGGTVGVTRSSSTWPKSTASMAMRRRSGLPFPRGGRQVVKTKASASSPLVPTKHAKAASMKAWTEYEGPSLSETADYLSELFSAMNPHPKSAGGIKLQKDVRKRVVARSQGRPNPIGLHPSLRGDI